MSSPASTPLASGLDVRFPVVLRRPRRFRVDRAETWPRVEGRLEFHEGELRYMPPCADEQGQVVFSLVTVLGPWVRKHREFIGGTNEQGMLLDGSVRAADGAVWRRDTLKGQVPGTFFRVPPVLAVEVAGQDEEAEVLREKARWYLEHGVTVVWLLFPGARSVEVLTVNEHHVLPQSKSIPAHPALPGLAPRVRDFFSQLD